MANRICVCGGENSITVKTIVAIAVVMLFSINAIAGGEAGRTPETAEEDSSGSLSSLLAFVKEHEESCARGIAASCMAVAVYLEKKPGEEGRAQGLYEKSCEMGEPTACVIAGGRYEIGAVGIEKDAKRAIAILKRGCSYGWADACSFAAQALHDEGKEKEAYGYYQKACENREAQACYIVALYNSGDEIIERDSKEYIRMMKMSCDMGYKDGCDALRKTHLKFLVLHLLISIGLVIIAIVATRTGRAYRFRKMVLMAIGGYVAISAVGLYLYFYHEIPIGVIVAAASAYGLIVVFVIWNTRSSRL